MSVNVPPLNLPRQIPTTIEENEDLDAIYAYLKTIMDEIQLWVGKLRALNP